MTFQLKLDQGDISRILAKYFNTRIDNVHLKIEEFTIGYGMHESNIQVINATIDNIPNDYTLDY